MSLSASLMSGLAVFVAYFILPFTSGITTHTVLLLGLGLIAVCALLVWQMQSIRGSATPVARGLRTITLTVPLFLVVFAVSYLEMGRSDPGTWSESLSRMDALYFTVTTFSTVGYGDITPVTQAARAVVTLQMALDLLIVGFVARFVVEAVRDARARKGPPRDDSAPVKK